MASIRYFVKKSKGAKTTVYVRVRHDNSEFNISSGLSVFTEDLSKGNTFIKKNVQNSTSKQLKTKLDHLKKTLQDDIEELLNTEKPLTKEWLRFQIDFRLGRIDNEGEKKKVITVTDHINHIIKTAPTRKNSKGGIGISENRISKYKLLATRFKEFRKGRSCEIKAVNKRMFDAFFNWVMVDKGYSETYACKLHSDLKGVCKDARANGIEVSKDLDSVKTHRPSPYKDDSDVIVLTEEEIHQIELLDLTEERLINARKWLIMACYTGQRGGDLTSINKDNFMHTTKGLTIRIKQKKGNKPVVIPVLPQVKKIFDEGLPYPLALSNLSEYFKELGKLAGIDTPTMGRRRESKNGIQRGVMRERPKYEYLSTHTGRRTFATIHYYKRFPLSVIMAVTGHANESTLRQYINKKDDSHLDAFLDYYKTSNAEMKVLKGKAANE